MKSLGREEIKG